MNELLIDIQKLESAVINLTEGASDEKRMAIYSLEDMIAEKKAVVEKFEKEMEKEMESI
tara:strand:+ start:798 stop:974 length:177 start_codon:yes stop_codon:yes gene_type:complete